ncbi:MAG: hypothetical protein GY756_05220 [bacterium]|nr:hypothetical protein [bacterium]
MENKFIGLTVVVLLLTLLCSGCSMFNRQDAPAYTPVTFSEHTATKPLTRIQNKNNPSEVIEYAKSLSQEGRFKDSAKIYLDASERFKSKTGYFEIDCRMAAVRELWLAGDINQARSELNSLENDQDIYSYSGESNDIKNLRKLLNDSKKIKNQTIANSK